MADFHLRLLHLSDLHETGPRTPNTWRRRRALGDLWKRNLDDLTRDGTPIDLVCFTGDIAASGLAAEYAAATDFVASTLERLSLPLSRLFVVPGNHDMQRGTSSAACRALRASLLALPADERSRWMAGGPTPAGCDPVHRERTFDRSASFRRWLRALHGFSLLPEASPHGRLGYRATLRIRNLPFDVHVIGLDSAWLSSDEGDDSGQLLLTEGQITHLMQDGGLPLGGFRLALVHHPLAYLADEQPARALLARHADLILRGHLHHEQLVRWVDDEQRVRELAAGCLYDSSQDEGFRTACHLVDLHFDAAGRPTRCDVRLRGFSPASGWFDDGELYGREAPVGRLSWSMRAPSPPPRPSRAETFVGREAELLALEQALLPASGEPRAALLCAHHGVPGVGTSTLAERFASLHAPRFPGGVHRISLQPDDTRPAEALFAELADRLHLCASAPDVVERLRARLRTPRALVIVEDADTWSAASAAAGLAERLPGCAILVTGRHRGIGRDAFATQIDVGALDPATALEQMQAELRLAREPGEGSGRLGELLEALGGLPLAVRLAAAQLSCGETPERLARALRQAGVALDAADLANPVLAAERSRALLSALVERSLDALGAALGEGNTHLLAGFAALSHAPAAGFGRSLGAAIAAVPRESFDRLARAASSFALLEPVPGRAGALRLCPTVAELLRGRPGAEAGRERLTAWFVDRLPSLRRGYEALQAQRWREIEQERAAIAGWLAQVGTDDLMRVARAGSKFAILNGPFQTWMDVCERGLLVRSDIAERSLLLWTLAQVAIRAGATERAMEAAIEKETLDRRRGNEREAALAAGCRADILELRGAIDEALRIRRHVELPVYERVGDERARAATLGKIADVLQTRGELDEALRIRRDEQLPALVKLGHLRSLAVTLGKIAGIHQALGELDEALRIRRDEQLPIYERLGDERERAATLGKIAAILRARGDVDEALRLRREQQLPMIERLGDARALIVSRANLARAYLDRGAPGDREAARELLAVARHTAESLRIPEVHQIRRLQAQHGLLPQR